MRRNPDNGVCRVCVLAPTLLVIGKRQGKIRAAADDGFASTFSAGSYIYRLSHSRTAVLLALLISSLESGGFAEGDKKIEKKRGRQEDRNRWRE